MNTENELQLTLLSNASITFSPDNKPANNTTTPPSPISLEGEWEVALIDIQYPHNWMNISKDVYIIFVFDTTKKETSFRDLLIGVLSDYRLKYNKELTETYKLLGDNNKKLTNKELLMLCARIPKGYYATVGELITTLNQEIQDSFSGKPEWEGHRTEQKKSIYFIDLIPSSGAFKIFKPEW